MVGLRENIRKLLKVHPGLSFDERDCIITGRIGIVSAKAPELGLLDSFDIEIHLNGWNPFISFPKVFEIKGKIPREPDRHINSDGSFCLAVRPEEFRICLEGIDLLRFIDNIVIPFLAVQSSLSEGFLDGFPQGEFSHGAQGLIEYYEAQLIVKEPMLILSGMNLILKGRLSRNSLCFCGSGNKTKRCHLGILIKLREYPKSFLQQDYSEIQTLFIKQYGK